MAVKLHKSVSRETIAVTSRRNETVIVTLLPGDMLGFRVKNKRTRFTISLAHCFNLAVLFDSMTKDEEAIKEYKQKKDAGYKRLRKPKKNSAPYSKFYFTALNAK